MQCLPGMPCKDHVSDLTQLLVRRPPSMDPHAIHYRVVEACRERPTDQGDLLESIRTEMENRQTWYWPHTKCSCNRR